MQYLYTRTNIRNWAPLISLFYSTMGFISVYCLLYTNDDQNHLTFDLDIVVHVGETHTFGTFVIQIPILQCSKQQFMYWVIANIGIIKRQINYKAGDIQLFK